MVNELEKLILYHPKSVSALMAFARALDCSDAGGISAAVGEMARLGCALGFRGNLWHCCLTHFLLTDENPYTLTRERREDVEDSLDTLARHDFQLIMRLFAIDLHSVLPEELADCLTDFSAGTAASFGIGGAVSDMAKVLALSADADEFAGMLSGHYAAFGVGELGHGSFFRLDDSPSLRLQPVRGSDGITLDCIVGCEEQKSEILRNTSAFAAGRAANNTLLYGDSGTGKSTCVKAVVNELSGAGVRLIEVYKHQFRRLPELVALLRGRNYPFIIFIDDLSFEDFEVEYKSLKAVIEGGVETRPENVLIYATSNRRHLVREDWSDRADMTHSGDVHRSDTLEEKLSLAGRFGLAVNFSAPRPSDYHDIVLALARRDGIDMEEKRLFTLADAWEIRHGGKSGRTARQFVDYLLSEGSFF